MAFTAPPSTTSPWSTSASASPITSCPLCHHPFPYQRTTPMMRSKREKRARPSFHTSSSPSNSSPAPLRIDVESSTLSLREQLKLARLASESSAPSKPLARTKFRRKKRSSFESGIDSPEQCATLPDGKYAFEIDPVLYIDAYNVIGAWPRLRKHRDKGDMESARQKLLHQVAEFAHVRGWQCVVVFDAQGTDLPARTAVNAQNVEIVFTGTETADTYIERSVYEHCEEGKRQVWAATSDVAQLSFSRAKGAHVMSASLFVQEMKRASKETREKVVETDESAARGKMLISNVDKDTRDALYALRDKLNGS